MKVQLVVAGLSLMFALGLHADGKKPTPSLAGKPATSTKSQTAPKTQNNQSTPSLAKKTELPPGLAKKFGKKRPDVAYVALDPKKKDEAWLLIDGKWKLEKGFDASLKREVSASLALPVVRPPVPLPKGSGSLRVVKFD